MDENQERFVIVCSCRNISDKNYTAEELIKRLKAKDIKCGICIRKK